MPTHTRIRMFNTKDTYPNQALDNDPCQAVRAGNTVYVRGQVGTNFDGNLVGLGDPQAQTEQAMKNLKQRPVPYRQDHHLHHRPALPRAGVQGGRQMAQGRVPDLHRAGGLGPRPAAVADGDRRDRGDPGRLAGPVRRRA